MVKGHEKSQGLSPPIKDNSKYNMSLQQGRPNHRPFINPCTLLQPQRELLRKNILKSGNWPVSEDELITKHEIIPYFYKINRL
jgi:hypothetical protein